MKDLQLLFFRGSTEVQILKAVSLGEGSRLRFDHPILIDLVIGDTVENRPRDLRSILFEYIKKTHFFLSFHWWIFIRRDDLLFFFCLFFFQIVAVVSDIDSLIWGHDHGLKCLPDKNFEIKSIDLKPAGSDHREHEKGDRHDPVCNIQMKQRRDRDAVAEPDPQTDKLAGRCDTKEFWLVIPDVIIHFYFYQSDLSFTFP